MKYWVNTLQALIFGFFSFVTLWVFGKINSADALKNINECDKDDKDCGKTLENNVAAEESLMFMMTVICTLSLIGLFISIAGMSNNLFNTNKKTGGGVGIHLFWLLFSIIVVIFNSTVLTNDIFKKIADKLSIILLGIMIGICGLFLLINAFFMYRAFKSKRTPPA